MSYIEVDKPCEIEGLNIWNFYWACSDRKVEVRHPLEGHVYFFNEYEISTNDQKIRFVAGEFSNNKVGLFIKDEFMDGKLL